MIKNKLREIRDLIIKEDNINRLKKAGLKVGNNFNMQKGCSLDYSHCWLIEIGDNVTLAPRVMLLAHDASTKMALGYTKIGRIKIGNNVFIGANTTILPNVKIGDNVIIGANSLISKDIESNTVIVGNPAKVISNYEEYIKKTKKQMEIRPIYDEMYTIRNKKITRKMKEQMIEELKTGIGFVE